MEGNSPFRGGRSIALIPLGLAALAVAAPQLATSPLVSFGIRRFFSIVCHQDPARSFWLAGAPVAVCVRCLGIYLGGAIGACIRVSRRMAFRMFVMLGMLNILDVAAEWVGLHGNLPLPRFALGLALGLAAGALVLSSPRDPAPRETVLSEAAHS